MYLYRRTYVQRWDHQKDEDKFWVTVTRGGEPYTEIDPKKVSYVTEQVGYWRKANAIHNWFVDNVQDGVDNCREFRADRAGLKELLTTINEVLASVELTPCPLPGCTTYHGDGRVETTMVDGEIVVNTQVCEELLPTRSGFFFGETEYNGWYVQDLQYTKKLLEELLEQDEGDYNVEYIYTSSW
jgi:hypothetical protein